MQKVKMLSLQTNIYSSVSSESIDVSCNGGKAKLICRGKKFKRILNSSEKIFYYGKPNCSYSVSRWVEYMTVEIWPWRQVNAFIMYCVVMVVNLGYKIVRVSRYVTLTVMNRSINTMAVSDMCLHTWRTKTVKTIIGRLKQ